MVCMQTFKYSPTQGPCFGDYQKKENVASLQGPCQKNQTCGGESTPSQGLGAGERGGWLEIQANCWRQIEAKGHCYEPLQGFTHTFNHSSQL